MPLSFRDTQCRGPFLVSCSEFSSIGADTAQKRVKGFSWQEPELLWIHWHKGEFLESTHRTLGSTQIDAESKKQQQKPAARGNLK